MLCGYLFEFALILPDTLFQLPDGLQQGAKSRHNLLWQVLGYFLVKTPRRALGQASPEWFHHCPDMVDQLRARVNQRLAWADERHMSLGVLTPVLERVKRLGIETGQAREVLGVELVGFALTAIYEPHLPGVSDQNLVATLFKQTTHPRRVGSHLDGDLEGLLGVKTPPESLRGRTQPTLFYDLAVPPRSSPAVIFGRSLLPLLTGRFLLPLSL
jgi:hypothetical protein